MRGFTTKIEILRPVEVEGEFSSGTQLDFSSPEPIPVSPLVSVQPLSSSEGPVERPTTVTLWQLYTPPGVDIPLRSTDRIRVVGSSLELSVVGDVQRWPHPIRPHGVHHVEAILEKVSG